MKTVNNEYFNANKYSSIMPSFHRWETERKYGRLTLQMRREEYR